MSTATATPTAASQANPQTGETTAPPRPGPVDAEFERLLQQEYSPRVALDGDNMDKMLRLAEIMADSKITVPKHLQGSVADCMAVITQAMLWNMNPFAVAQKTHVVNGALGYEAQLVNAVVSTSSAVRGHFHYEYRGDGAKVECRVGNVLRGDTEITWGEWLCADTVTTKNSPLWKTNPKQQLGYLQVKNWARAFCPGAILGVYTTDEMDDLPPVGATVADLPRNATPTQIATAAAPKVDATERHKKLGDELLTIATEQGVKAFKKAWNALAEEDRVAIGIAERDNMLAAGKRTDEQNAAIEKMPAEGGANG
jgi:hypothetical protein